MSEEQIKNVDDSQSNDDQQATAGKDYQVSDDGQITLLDGEQGAVAKPIRLTGAGVKPDHRYESELISKFINCLMLDGKKSTARKILDDSFTIIADKLKIDPYKVFVDGIENAKPMVEVKSKRVGGANYQVPVEVKAKRRQTLAIRWILEAVRGRKGRPTAEKLAQEMIDCYNKTGTTIQKREATHRMAEANKAFSHFA